MRFIRHKKIGNACQEAISALGMKQVPTSSIHSASTLTAPYYPQGISGSEFLSKVRNAGVILAGGLHPKIKAEYFRIGHMGAVTPGDILATIGAIESGLFSCKYDFEPGTGVSAAQNVLQNME